MKAVAVTDAMRRACLGSTSNNYRRYPRANVWLLF
jgi:hypothetical protein